MTLSLQPQSRIYFFAYALFGIISAFLLIYYLSVTIIHFTTPYQFPVNSLSHFPLTLLIFPAEVFALLFGLYFVYTLFAGRKSHLSSQQQPFDSFNASITPIAKTTKNAALQAPVAILLPVYNEPSEILRKTIAASLALRWQGPLSIYILDDSTDKKHIKEVKEIAQEFSAVASSSSRENKRTVRVLRRPNRTGYKAGNVNNGVKHISEPFFAIFDVDQQPEPSFLQETMPFFVHDSVGFVQTPQYFSNDTTPLERASKIGANIFFQSQTMSKSQDGAMPFCGTNVVVRKQAFEAVNGFSYYTATEDIDLGLRMNAQGYFGHYVPLVMARGYAPQDFSAYASQQYRWANGNLAILREHWRRILFCRSFSLRYQIHTFFTLGWWLIGIVSFIFILTPLLSLFFGLGTHHAWLSGEVIGVLYIHVGLGISMIYFSLAQRDPTDKVRLRDALLEYSLITNSMFIYMKAAFAALFKRYAGFVRTSKERSFAGLVHIKWNLLLALLCFFASIYALVQGLRSPDLIGMRTYLPVSVWLLFYTLVLASSLLFVGKQNDLQYVVRQQALAASQQSSSQASQH